ncbi:hypothetical protein ES332_A12G170800v1 [Gossypium tomentosum]|uniref:Bifunctional inhibitor/plant lipid transfer protein/seed storage helical domain-containing protein n=1 Tax=Gossypium tomentosum TaxID=34277 RepID=A0A5D2N0P9_GOSTO|nr:hypothetical protein ES332_A12G170800v1 [Gossypium tomentosum]
MEKFSFNLFIFAAILIFATHSEMMAEARGPVISCRCSEIEDCQDSEMMAEARGPVISCRCNEIEDC